MPRPRRRGAFLLTLGTAWVGHGVGIAFDPRYGTAQGLSHVTRYVPLTVLGWGWVTCGVLAVVAGLAGMRLQPLGFAAIGVPAGMWGAAWAVTWASGDYPPASGAAAVWTGFALATVWVSGLQERPHPMEVSRWT
ncbi:hypothetical protein [Streptomyces sioyaensis]|uniref:hypothetical protein n=1 Tax=Streptomyces sioyaensis TaxID=67364 RepID=UPI003D70568D